MHQCYLYYFLDRCFIEQADIKDVSPALKVALSYVSIEKAADVDWNKVPQVRGFGVCMMAALVDWRKSCERRFTFNSKQMVFDIELMRLRYIFASKKRQLSNGALELQRFSKVATTRAAGLEAQAEWTAQKLAQAQADLSAL